MNPETASTTLDKSNEVLQSLKGLEPTLAVIVVLGVVSVLIIYLLTRYGNRQSQPTEGIVKIAADAQTQLSEERKLAKTLQDTVAQLQIQMNNMTHDMKDLKEQNEALKNAQTLSEQQRERREAELNEKLETLQKSLDAAQKTLDDQTALLKQKEMREAELTNENTELRREIAAMRKQQSEEVAALQRQIADLQMQLNQFLKLPEVMEMHNEVSEDSTPSPDL